MVYSAILYLLWFTNGDTLAEERSLKERFLGISTSTRYLQIACGSFETPQVNAALVTRNGP
jgi:hypothetical protein